MSAGHSAAMLRGWGVKAGWLIPLVYKHVPRLSALEMSIAQLLRRCTNILFTLLYFTYLHI